MEHTYLLIGMGVFALAAIVSMVCSHSLTQRIGELKDELDKANAGLEKAKDLIRQLNIDGIDRGNRLRKAYEEIIDRDMSVAARAETDEIPAPGLGTFRVYREGDRGRYTVKTFPYDPSDPDDRDYARICAEELADTLNEKP